MTQQRTVKKGPNFNEAERFTATPAALNGAARASVTRVESNQIYHEDCRVGLQRIPDESVDAVITDPPYGLCKLGVDNDQDTRCYRQSLPHLYRVLKRDAFFVTFASNERNLPQFFANNPFRFVRQHAAFCGKGGFMCILVFRKGRPREQGRLQSALTLPPPWTTELRTKQHPTQKSVRLLSELVAAYSSEGDLILDPFAGVGTTCESARRLGRRFLGFETNRVYVERARRRIQAPQICEVAR